jgi:glucose-6-phosphate isomerase
MLVKLNYENALSFVKKEDIEKNKELAENARKHVLNRDSVGSDFLGWVDYPLNFDQEEYARIKKAAKKIQGDSQVLVVIGIGGSYLGAKAVVEAMKPYFKKQSLEIIFAGNTLSSSYTSELLSYLEDKDFSVNVISKSGTTTEPAVCFRVLKELLEKKYGKKACERIYATTDKAKGALRNLATQEGYETFIVPDDIGGRYSWFTAVGLLPICASGVDIDGLMEGAKECRKEVTVLPYEQNDAMLYASLRNLLYKSGKKIEIQVTYEPRMMYVNEWWKQLFGESEGKDHLGLFPSSLVYSTDLHSMGQYVQEGERTMFETVLSITNPQSDVIMKKEAVDLDQLNYLSGKNLDSVCKKAMEGTVIAHTDGGVPNLMLTIDQIDAKHLGYLLYFYMFSCGVGCYMLGVNPFNQPGVESYKKNMFALLNKPGYEELSEELKKRFSK